MFKLSHRHGFNAAGLPPLTSLSYVANVADGDVPILSLAGLSIQPITDLLILLWHAPNGGVWSTPSGWSLIGQINDAREMAAAYKIANGSEVSVAVDDTAGNDVQVMQFRGNGAINNVVSAGYQSVVTSGNPGAQTINSGSGTPPVLVIADFHCAGATDSGDVALSPTTGASSTGFATLNANDLAAYAIWDAAPINSGCDVGDRGSFTGMQSFYLSLS